MNPSSLFQSFKSFVRIDNNNNNSNNNDNNNNNNNNVN